MIIFREKLFRRDEFTDYPFLLDDPELVKELGPSKLSIEVSRKYNNDISKLGMKGTPDRNRLEALKRDIHNGFLISDGPAGGETHYLGDYSRLRKYHTFSKKITEEHRLNYRIYPPQKYIISGKAVHLMRVVLDSCFGHETTEGDYLNDKELRERKDRMRKNAPYRKPESILSGKNTKNYRGRKNRK